VNACARDRGHLVALCPCAVPGASLFFALLESEAMASASVPARAGLAPLRRTARRVAVALAAITGLLGLPIASSAQSQRSFGDWVAVCQTDTAGYCSANARIRRKGDAVGGQSYAFRLQVWRAQAGDPLQITFISAASKPGEGQPLLAQVDRSAPQSFEPGVGYRSIRGGNAFALGGESALAELLSRMHRGKRLEVRYVDAAGKTVSAVFSLTGFKPALQSFHRGAPPAPPREARPEVAPKVEAAPEPAPKPETPPAPQATSKPEAAPVPEAAPTPPARPSGTPAKPPQPTGSERVRKPAVVTDVAPPQQPAANAGPPPRKGRRGESLRQFACRGNEPSWSLALDHERGTLTLPDLEPRAFTGKFSISGEGRTPIMTWKGRTSGEPRDLTAIIVEQACRDSMSDGEGQTAFAFLAQVTLPDGRKVRGCCNAGLAAAPAASAPPALATAPVADFAAKSAEDWARLLPELQPAVDACLARTPGSAPYVTKAWPMNKGMVGVRTRGGDGTWYECIAQADGAVVERIEMLARGEPPLQGENFTLFTPAGGTPRAGNCWQHERVLDAAGALKGYLSYNTC
jgi:uncharacterized membrane protein/invasion protein IalB